MIYDFELEKVKKNTPYWYVCDNITHNQKILDVGCATGYLGLYLRKNFDVDIIGIDNQDYHLDKARKLKVYSALINLDLNSFDDELDKYISYFDRIVICDVLEHLNHPMEVLTKLSKFLKPDGKFLVDVPNIAHASIKYNLLLNNFNYTTMGLLDESHLRFYTKNSIINELTENKFFIEKMEYIFQGPGQNKDQFVDYSKFPREIIEFIENNPESSIYQIFIIFHESDLDLESLTAHNLSFNKLNDHIIAKKESYDSENINNPLQTLEEFLLIKDKKISNLKEKLVELDLDIKSKDNDISNLQKELDEKNDSIIRLNHQTLLNRAKMNDLKRVVDEMKYSHSWKITKPLRELGFLIRKIKNWKLKSKPGSTPKDNAIIETDKKSSLYKTIYLENLNKYSKYYVKKSKRDFERNEDDIKLIAFYLPQYHTIEENDKWWGEGFTEWVNVTRAIPQIAGQYQPQLPDELGFYDLSHNDVFYKQIEIAKKYGIYGFCFHYYWFSGHRLLEKPIFNYLKDKNLDFPFMLCWANEPWTRAWDGSEREILMPQNFEEEDYLKFIKDIMPFFKDDRYIKVNNCPMLIIYRPQYFSKETLNNAIQIWRGYVKENGFEDLYLINAESHDFDSENKYENFDASVQFFSYKMSKNWHRDLNVDIINPEFKGLVYDYESFVKEKTYLQDFDYTLYRTVLPSWDNTARTMSKAIIFNNSSPELYKEWLTNVMEYTKKNYSEDNQFVFLHSWNEWAEGAHLEPDRKYGFAYLASTLDAIEEQRKK